jgi:hypothetical protein
MKNTKYLIVIILITFVNNYLLFIYPSFDDYSIEIILISFVPVFTVLSVFFKRNLIWVVALLSLINIIPILNIYTNLKFANVIVSNKHYFTLAYFILYLGFMLFYSFKIFLKLKVHVSNGGGGPN